MKNNKKDLDYSGKDPILLGGIGEKKSNGGTQWFLQNRIYKADVALTVTTCCHPYYLVVIDEENISIYSTKRQFNFGD